MPKKPEPIAPFGLDMDPDEMLERLARTDAKEVDDLERRSKKKKPPQAKKKPGGKRPPGATGENVVSLRQRRMRKRNYGR